ncbi:hypothetical protein CsSME_00024864 [Camellia sinensis var. sinensis]
MMDRVGTGKKLEGETVSGCVRVLEEKEEEEEEEISVDWRGRPCKPNSHGCSFIVYFFRTSSI